jgi:hypothetical protein
LWFFVLFAIYLPTQLGEEPYKKRVLYLQCIKMYLYIPYKNSVQIQTNFMKIKIEFTIGSEKRFDKKKALTQSRDRIKA